MGDYPQTIQCWPEGKEIVYWGDTQGDGELNIRQSDAPGITHAEAWRPATDEERHAVRRNELAAMYLERDVWACDTSLVEDLMLFFALRLVGLQGRSSVRQCSPTIWPA